MSNPKHQGGQHHPHGHVPDGDAAQGGNPTPPPAPSQAELDADRAANPDTSTEKSNGTDPASQAG